MSNKFGRNYRLTVESNDGSKSIIIKPPFTCQFTLVRSTMASLNTCEISILNLAEKTRGTIYRDRYNMPFVGKQKVTLEAGYDQLSTVFSGSIFEANSSRQGVNVSTNISSRDGGFEVSSSTSNITLKDGSSVYDAIQALIADFKKNGGNIDIGAISPDYKKTIFNRPVVLNGNTLDLIQKYADNTAYIDLEKLYVIKNNETVEGTIPLISSQTGMIGTPRRDDAILTVTILFEPRVVLGQQVQLVSEISKIYNGVYKVIGIQHQGIISEAVGGVLQTVLTLLTGSSVYGALKPVQTPSVAPATKVTTPAKNSDVDNVAKTLYGEARGEGTQGMQAVANVIANRTQADGFPSTFSDVVLQKSQFSVWNPITGGSADSSIIADYNTMVSATSSDAQYAQALSIANQAVAGTLPDITNGATNYYAGSTPPYWAKTMTVTAVIGNQTFLKK